MDAQRLSEATKSSINLQPCERSFLRQEIEARKQLIARLTSECRSYELLLSPMRQNILPPEVLGEIFSHVVTEPDLPVTAHWQVRNICLVCTTWRRAALSTPQLWCSVQVFGLQARKKSYFDRAVVWFMRGHESLSKTLQVYE